MADAHLFSICPSSIHISTCWLWNQRRPSSLWTSSAMTPVTITVRSWNSKHFLKANGFQMWTFTLWAHLSWAWLKMPWKWVKTLNLELEDRDRLLGSVTGTLAHLWSLFSSYAHVAWLGLWIWDVRVTLLVGTQVPKGLYIRPLCGVKVQLYQHIESGCIGISIGLAPVT